MTGSSFRLSWPVIQVIIAVKIALNVQKGYWSSGILAGSLRDPRLQHIGLLRGEADRSEFGIHALSPRCSKHPVSSLRFAALNFGVGCHGSSNVTHPANTPA